MANTSIVRQQVRDGAINDAKIGSDAAIASNKLADGANFLKKDGSVVATAPQDMGGFVIHNVGTPAVDTDAASRGYVLSVMYGLDWKNSVRTATTAPGTLATSFANGQTVGGVVVATGDRILIKDQTAGAENGLYTVNASGPPTRTVDADGAGELTSGCAVYVSAGTNQSTQWTLVTADPITIGTTSLSFGQIGGSTTYVGSSTIIITGNSIAVDPATVMVKANFIVRETPSGTINGSNATFTLANTPVAGSESVYLNGLLLDPGAGNDYTISGGTITMLIIPQSGDKLRVSYLK